jgi:hypothetical protein
MVYPESAPSTLTERLIALQVRMQGTTDEEIEEALSAPTTSAGDKVVEVTRDFQETEPRPDYALTRTA